MARSAVNKVKSTINTEQMERCIALLIAADIPGFFWGPKGIGKSSVFAQTVAKLNLSALAQVRRQIAEGAQRELALDPETEKWHFWDIRTADKSPEDIGGIPYPNQETKKLDYWLLSTLPFDTNKKGIILFDEIDRTDQPMYSVLLPVFLDREVNGHKLSPNVRLFAAGNGMTDIGTTPLPDALKNRGDHFYMEYGTDAAHEAWEAWALNEGVSPILTGFANFDRETWLNGNVDGIEYEDLAEMTPRSGVMADKIIQVAAQVGFPTADILPALVKGCVGEAAGTELLAFRTLYMNAPTMEEVVRNPKGCKMPSDKPDILYALANALAQHARQHKEDSEAIAEYGLRFPEEPRNRFFRVLLDAQPDVAVTKSYNVWNTSQLSDTAQAKRRNKYNIFGAADEPEHDPQPAPQAAQPAPVTAPVAAPVAAPQSGGIDRTFQKAVLAAYPGRSTPKPDNNNWINRVEIVAKSGNKYLLSEEANSGEKACDCPAWKNNVSRPCKHLKEVQY